MLGSSTDHADSSGKRRESAREARTRFEASWRAGHKKTIEAILSEVTEAESEEVLRQLLDAEISLRVAEGDAPTIEDYEDRFPGLCSVVSTVFDENGLTTLNAEPGDDGSTAALDSNPGETVTGQSTEEYENENNNKNNDREPVEIARDEGGQPESIGRYQVLGILGNGSFGRVFQALDTELNRQVAIKMPHARRLVGPSDVEAYLNEARNVAKLDHPGIVPVFDVGRTDDGSCFVVSKLIRGTDLASWLRATPPTPRQSASLVAALAEALDVSHKHGLVHRDVKPRNVLIDEEGRPYLADFGLALREEDHGLGPRFAGTLAYMSPEQARSEGHLVDGRSDIFSLGVVFYEMLTGERPFRGESPRATLEQIKMAEPRPPRLLAPTADRELERICLKALSKRLVDRYATAREMAADLRRHLGEPEDPHGSSVTAPRLLNVDEPANSTVAEVVVPKGLRCFDAGDAEFFLALMPGPRDRDGLPERIRFWKTRVEEPDPGRSFRVGVVYGPSGCGKSSMIRAGLLPRLARGVSTVLVDASAMDTEARLLDGLRARYPGLAPGATLAEALSALRRGKVPDSASGSTKAGTLLIVIDQFEQWLNANPASDALELVAALRQCDGRRVQCLLIVRDDFWMSLTRFMQELEIRLVEGQSCASADLFDVRHAAKVLTAFGRAYGALPEYPNDPTPDQTAFVGQAVADLARDGRVVPVHLSLFAETVKERPWTPATLRDFGGSRGVGVAFLDESFTSPTAPPGRKAQRQAAQEALKILLPAHGGDIRGHQRTRLELLHASGHAEDSPEFDALLETLDTDLRLITPVDTRGAADSPAPLTPTVEPRYQLTHDYLVSSIREWVNRMQLGTPRGRAEVLLAERASLWLAKPEPRYLPTTLECLSIWRHTRLRDRSPGERKMLAVAARRIIRGGALVAGAVLAVAIAGMNLRGVVMEEFRSRQSEAILKRLMVAEPRDLPATLEELKPYEDRLAPHLSRLAAESPEDSKAGLVASLALLGREPSQAAYLSKRLLSAGPDEAEVIVNALKPFAATVAPRFLKIVQGDGLDRGAVLRAGAALAAIAPVDPAWKAIGRDVATALVTEDTYRLPSWVALLRPAKADLTPGLTDLLHDPDRPDAVRARAAEALGEYLSGEVDRLAALVLDVEPEPFRILAPRLKADPARALSLFEAELGRPADPQWNDDTDLPQAAPHLVAQVEAAEGLFDAHFALCQSLPIDDFEPIARGLEPAGYRPVSFRPYRSGSQTLVTAAWTRDDRPWRLAISRTALEIEADDRAHRADGFVPVDLACETSDGTGRGYHAVWCRAGSGAFAPWGEDLLDSALYVGVPEPRHESRWSPLNQAGYIPRSNFMTLGTDKKPLYNSVRWKFKVPPRYIDTWGGDPWEAINTRVDRASDLALFPADVRFDPTRGDAQPHTYATVWWSGGGRLAASTQGLAPADHLARCRELAASGHRPAAISVAAFPKDKPVAASVWLLPAVSDSRKDAMANRKANAAAASLLLGKGDRLWRALRWRDDPRLKTALVARLPWLDIPPDHLANHLADEPDVTARRALILALAGYEPDRLAPEVRASALARLARLWQNDPDPGVHSAADLALRRWGSPPKAPSVAYPLEGRKGRGWFVDSEGQTMAVVDGPLTFTMGSPGSEEQREHHNEMLHAVTINRSVAVATTEVTTRQFARFDPHHASATRYAPDPDCPVNMVSWFEAARYCNWRSLREGIPRDQWCYPDSVDAGSTPVANAYQKAGYRLPGDAEWEYLGRAGTTTSRYFGASEALLPLHAWTVANSGYQSSPVGRLLPNDFGLFDMLGNALELCHDISPTPPQPAEIAVEKTPYQAEAGREMRGGSFLYLPSSARSAQRDQSRFRSLQPYIGFRVVRTLPSLEKTPSVKTRE